MSAGVKLSVSISKAIFDQTQQLAQELSITPDDLVSKALEDFIANNPTSEIFATKANPPIINQGDVYWVQLSELATTIPHPHVVIQDNILNHSRINTVVVCGLTSNLRRVNLLGNILLDIGEANLPKQSIIEVSKVSTIEKADLAQYIGSISAERVNQILASMRFLQQSFFAR